VTALRVALVDYLALRRALGHKLADAERQLTRFVAALDDRGAVTVTHEAAVAFVCDPALDPATSVPMRRLTALRGFARHLAGSHPDTYLPPLGMVTYRPRRRTPFLYSDGDIAALMGAAAATAGSALRAATIPTLIGLLAVTGMRVGEALRLHVDRHVIPCSRRHGFPCSGVRVLRVRSCVVPPRVVGVGVVGGRRVAVLQRSGPDRWRW